MINKDSIVRNTLIQEIIRVDMLKISNLSDILTLIDPIMKNSGFEFSENDVYGINITVNDPQELITQKFITNINKTVDYQYIKGDETIVINDYMIIFQKSDFSKYKGIEPYINLLKSLLEIIVSKEHVAIKRIGIRKINKVYGKKIETINDVFSNGKIDVEAVSSYQGFSNYTKEALIQNNQNNNMNILKAIDNGIANIEGKDVNLFSTTLDLDAYSRNVEYSTVNEIIEKMNELTNLVYDVFSKHENEILVDILTGKDISDYEFVGMDDNNE